MRLFHQRKITKIAKMTKIGFLKIILSIFICVYACMYVYVYIYIYLLIISSESILSTDLHN